MTKKQIYYPFFKDSSGDEI